MDFLLKQYQQTQEVLEENHSTNAAYAHVGEQNYRPNEYNSSSVGASSAGEVSGLNTFGGNQHHQQEQQSQYHHQQQQQPHHYQHQQQQQHQRPDIPGSYNNETSSSYGSPHYQQQHQQQPSYQSSNAGSGGFLENIGGFLGGGGANSGGGSHQQPSSYHAGGGGGAGSVSSHDGEGILGKLNSLAGGGETGERKEDLLDKAVDFVQEKWLGQGDQSNESFAEQRKDEAISDAIRTQFKNITGKDFPVQDK